MINVAAGGPHPKKEKCKLIKFYEVDGWWYYEITDMWGNHYKGQRKGTELDNQKNLVLVITGIDKIMKVNYTLKDIKQMVSELSSDESQTTIK